MKEMNYTIKYKSLCDQAIAAGYVCFPNYGYDKKTSELPPVDESAYKLVSPGTSTQTGDDFLEAVGYKWMPVQECGVCVRKEAHYVRRRVKVWHEL